MRVFNKFLLNLVCVGLVLTLFYYCAVSNKPINDSYVLYKHAESENSTSVSAAVMRTLNNTVNVWFIFAKVTENAPLHIKFENLIKSLFTFNSVPLHINVISDNASRVIAERILQDNLNMSRKVVLYTFYDMAHSVSMVKDLVNDLKPYFSSQPGAYYNDALFYLSLGLHRIAPREQTHAIMLDCDVKFMNDAALLYNQFGGFGPTTLFGLAHELTPVYRHVLYAYRARHNTTFGEYEHAQPVAPAQNHPRGFPGYNSGVVLFNLSAIRQSDTYRAITTRENVARLVRLYRFKGHLGDQDLYTLLGYEYPRLFHTLPCVFNRQLCVWWRDNGYSDVFADYSRCDGDIVIYHGNCNSQIPK